ncbi:MAG: hypothetical protein AB1585_11845 [Thermodesulfobacteriota bacterium]
MYPPKVKKSRTFCTFIGAVLFLNIFLCVQEIGAVTKTALINVTVRVMAYIQVKSLSQLSEFTISEEDIRRGYIDLISASRLVVKTNSNDGYVFTFEGNLGTIKEVQVQGLASPVQLVSGSASVSQPSIRGTTSFNLSYRFILSENTRPGIYAWPIAISIQTA